MELREEEIEIMNKFEKIIQEEIKIVNIYNSLN